MKIGTEPKKKIWKVVLSQKASCSIYFFWSRHFLIAEWAGTTISFAIDGVTFVAFEDVLKFNYRRSAVHLSRSTGDLPPPPLQLLRASADAYNSGIYQPVLHVRRRRRRTRENVRDVVRSFILSAGCINSRTHAVYVCVCVCVRVRVRARSCEPRYIVFLRRPSNRMSVRCVTWCFRSRYRHAHMPSLDDWSVDRSVTRSTRGKLLYFIGRAQLPDNSNLQFLYASGRSFLKRWSLVLRCVFRRPLTGRSRRLPHVVL